MESDWKKFRQHVPQWRKRYLERKNVEIRALLCDQKATPTEQFWNAEELIRQESKILHDCLDGHSRSKMWLYLMLMYRYGMIDDDDMQMFSEELRSSVLNCPE